IISAIAPAVAATAGASVRLRAAISAGARKAVLPALTAIAASLGRWTIHISSPSTALVAQARSCCGLGKTTALAIIQASTGTACVHLRVHTGTSTSGVVPHRLHALKGLACRSKTFRLSRAIVPDIPQL